MTRGILKPPIPGAPQCRLEWCERTAETAGLCTMHYARMRRGRPLSAPPMRNDKAETLREAALAYADSETDAEFAANWSRLRHAAERYGRRPKLSANKL